MKELLDLLDERVTSLLEEVHGLRQENEQLQQDLMDIIDPLEKENAMLKEALAQERTAKETAVERIDALLRRLTKPMPE